MGTENDLDLFARVEGTEITEFPVYRIHIRNRAHPMSWYTPVIDAAKPALPDFAYYKRTLNVKEGFVEATYEVVMLTLDEVLAQITQSGSGIPGEEVPINIADVPPATIQHVYKLAGDYVKDKLNAFAATRGYDDIISLCDYRDSTFEKFNVEGKRGYFLKDQAWIQLTAYFNEVLSGAKPIPKSSAEVDAVMPVFTWE